MAEKRPLVLYDGHKEELRTGDTLPGEFDLLSTLVSNEVPISAATTLDASSFGKMHLCSGTTADYAITLPPVTGNAGKQLGFRMASTMTVLAWLDGNGTNIDGEPMRGMWANEVAILMCDGTAWTKVGGKSIPMFCKLLKESSQTVVTNTITKAEFTSLAESNNTVMADLAGHRIYIPRKGRWNTFAQNYWNGITAGGDYQSRIHFNDAAGVKNIGQDYSIAGNYPGPLATTVISAGQGDFVLLYLYQTSGVDQNTYASEPINFLTVQEVPSW